MEGKKMTKEINNPKTNESPEENEEIKKVVVKPIEEPTRLYFSSPCLLSEIEDDEDILNL
ncbi:hypothetical protein [Sunxiuqinia dokdonensis]|uniref:Uncharacterized protein n=1 Tax=Sunxiuqinia dokdonensis TaxID=1409788 RepID=A0A0L8V4W4_9BACT|nr:hypothetical protein [Sunxiuqinia dokdonensis]KOH43530.1 hypothetical protein NC99_36140 [Sunxiuqinia dokdonensis]